ncbi:LysR family transcriptional regulator [Sphingobium phenoxybenzoativorans]|uniref:LysR family transcriptional regulator n=1 Tax=Sphingobium phenoxybenzoativorans TaxID=1592790 RepID=UPI000871CD0C|nr:LysR substrate-binding domain-containing protein [Sphingobium phenoxybenzoativorans]
MIDRYLLRYFLAVVDQGNFSRAAAQCNVSQPTLSVGIAKLERSLDASLFSRSSQRVQLTEAGNRFLIHARRIEREFNLAHQAMAGASAAPVLRIGILHSIPGATVAAAIRDARGQDPDATVELVYGSERELVGHLARGRIEVAATLVERGSDRFLEQPLATEGFALAMGKEHRLAARTDIAAEELASEVMIVRRHCEALSETSRYFTERGVRPHFALRSTNDERVLQMVAAGLGITVMPESYAHEAVVRPKLAGFEFQRTLGFAFGHDAEPLRAQPTPLLDALGKALAARAGQSPAAAPF